MRSDFRLPDFSQRVTIMGRTGSGKTQFAAWLLSEAPYHKIPYVIVDYKRDELLNAIDRAEEIGLKDVPKHPGVYILHPQPDDDLNSWLWKVWKRGRCGLQFDEMYNVPDPMKGSALRAILTQGRSLKIPAICLTQRPAWVSRFIFSEADYYCAFHLNTKGDVDKVREFFPGNHDKRLPQYHARWYDVGKDASFILQPAPDAETILDRFDTRLSPKRKIF